MMQAGEMPMPAGLNASANERYRIHESHSFLKAFSFKQGRIYVSTIIMA